MVCYREKKATTPRSKRLLLLLVLLASLFGSPAAANGQVRYRIDAAGSKFMVRAFSGGLLWFKGHDHFIAARDFSGEVMVTPQTITPASLEMVVQTNSLVETRDVFTEAQKQIINRELREIVLETETYPTITFKSTRVTGKSRTNESFDVKIQGDLTMHGVTRQIEIPARVTITGSVLRASGKFDLDRGDFKVKATSAFHGMVRVRDRLEFTFDILARRM